MSAKFELGRIYWSNPAVGKKSRVMIPIGRAGEMVTVAFLDGVGVGFAEEIEGREFLKVTDEADTYVASSACEVSENDASIVRDMLKRS